MRRANWTPQFFGWQYPIHWYEEWPGKADVLHLPAAFDIYRFKNGPWGAVFNLRRMRPGGNEFLCHIRRSDAHLGPLLRHFEQDVKTLMEHLGPIRRG